MSSLGLRRMMRLTATTNRAPAMVNGVRRGAMVAHLAGVKCTPADPVDAETKKRLGLESAYTLWQTFTAGGQDIQASDELLLAGKTYTIKVPESWGESTAGGDGLLRLIMEELTQ